MVCEQPSKPLSASGGAFYGDDVANIATITTTMTAWDEWRRLARCQGDAGADFYPPFGGERKRERLVREQRAKAVCATCPVATPCLEQAVATGERYGVWGGLNAEERLGYRRSA